MARRVRTILAAKSRTRSTSTRSDEYGTCAHRIDESTIGRTGSEETSQQRKGKHSPSHTRLKRCQKKSPYIRSSPAESRLATKRMAAFDGSSIDCPIINGSSFCGRIRPTRSSKKKDTIPSDFLLFSVQFGAWRSPIGYLTTICHSFAIPVTDTIVVRSPCKCV